MNANILSHLKFHRKVALYLLKSSTQAHRQVRSSASPNLPADLRYNGVECKPLQIATATRTMQSLSEEHPLQMLEMQRLFTL